MDRVDDTTGPAKSRLADEETFTAAANTLQAWTEKIGVPQALHVDWKNLYKCAAPAVEHPLGEEPTTQFRRMREKLGIRILAACSPYAKTRAVRTQGTHKTT